MLYGVVTSLSAPIEVYDQIHTGVIGNAATAIQGLLVHIGRPSPAGFDVVEVGSTGHITTVTNAN